MEQKPDLNQTDVALKNNVPQVERAYLPVGTKLGRYTIIEEIDRGGMAVVYKALQTDLNRIVALKVLPANITINTQFVERFISEAHAIAQLNHEHIVSIFEVAVEQNVYFIAMEYIPGKNLFYYLNFSKPKLLEVLDIMVKLCDALFYAHSLKIIHRDLKLNNVIMKDCGTPVLIDFGLAKTMTEHDQHLTKTGEIIGSPAYMAPERLTDGVADERSDICSLGIMLYEMVTFKNPYLDQRSMHQTTINVMESNPIRPRKLVPWLPVEIEAITLKSMAKDPRNRYQTMAEFKADIQRYQQGQAVLAHPPSRRERIVRWLRHNGVVIGISAITLLFTAIIIFILYSQDKREQTPWRQVYREEFQGKSLGNDWILGGDSLCRNCDSARWQVNSGELVASAGTLTFARLQRPLGKDVRVEFNLHLASYPGPRELFDVGCFLFGDNPGNGYRLWINRNGKPETGTSLPKQDLLLSDCSPFDLVPDSVYHVVCERSDNVLTMRINNVVVTRYWDFFPPAGTDHLKFGVWVSGSGASFSKVKIYRKTSSLMPGPTIVAQRFMEQGDIHAALKEYRELLFDFPQNELTTTVLLNIIECMIRTGATVQADSLCRSTDGIRAKSEMQELRLLLLKGILYSQRGASTKSDSVLNRLASQSPHHLINQTAAALRGERILQHILSDSLVSAETELVRMTGNYPDQNRLVCGLNRLLLKAFLDKGKVVDARRIGERMVEIYAKDNELLLSARIDLGGVFLASDNLKSAMDCYNRSVANYSITSVGMWDAWLAIAGINEQKNNYADAVTVYTKIINECPPSVEHSFIARLRRGVLARRIGSGESLEQACAAVDTGNCQFPVQRLIAQVYLGTIPESTFIAAWQRLRGPSDTRYLYHLAMAEAYAGNTDRASQYLQELKQQSLALPGKYHAADNMLNTLHLW